MPSKRNKIKSDVQKIENKVLADLNKKPRRRRAKRTAGTVVVVNPKGARGSNTARKALRNKNRTRFTPAGKAWLDLYLNPMGRQEPSLAGYPDGSATDAVLAQYRQDFNISFPTAPFVGVSDISPDTQYTQAQLDVVFPKSTNCTLLLLSPPALGHIGILRLYQETPTSFVIGDLDPTSALSTYPNWLSFTPAGERTASVTEAVGYLQSFVVLSNTDAHASQSLLYRMVSRGLTGEYTVPELQKQGFVTAAQFATEPRDFFTSKTVVATATYNAVGPVVDTTTASVISDRFLGIPAGNISPNTLVQAYHGAYTNKAYEGFYMPLLSVARDLKFTTPLKEIYRVLLPSTTAPAGYTSSYDLFRDHLTTDWNVGVVWFEGISTDFSLKLKTRTVVEYVPLPGSEITNFSRTSADEDLPALEAAFYLRHKMAHAYPSCYNSWGWLGDLVEGAVGLIPGIGSFAKPFVKPVWNWIGGKVSNWLGNPIHKDGDVWYDAKQEQ